MNQQNESIISKAAELGELIARSAAGQAVLQASEKLQADTQARELLQRFQQQARKIAESEATGRAIEPEDKRALAQLQQQVASHPTLKTWMKAQADFSQLMRKVDQAISQPLQPPAPEGQDG